MLGRTIIIGLGVVVLGAALLAAPGDSPVADAAMRGDRETVRELLRQGVDVNAAQGDGMTALHWAAQRDDRELAQMLLFAGANVRATTRLGGYTPLGLASRAGSAPMVETLLRAGAAVDRPTSTGATPLMLAAASGHADAVEALLEHGAEVDATESAMGQTALMFAAAANRVDALEMLLARGADPAIQTRIVDIVEKDADRRRKREAERRVAAAAAPERRPVERRRGASAPIVSPPFGGGGQPTAARAESRPAAAATLSPPFGAGGPPRRSDATAERLSYADLVGVEGGMTALLYASRQGHLESTSALLEAGADVNQASGDRSSPLLVATINGHFDLARFLLTRGADPNLASAAGATPLYGAINVQWAPHAFYPQPDAGQEFTTHLDLMAALLDHGADPNARIDKKLWYTGYNFDQSGVDEQGSTAFWRAAQAADVEAMRLLVAAGADPTVPTRVAPSRRRPGAQEYDYPEPPRPIGGPAVTPLQAASGAGYDGNYHRQAPGGFLSAVRYLVEELGADVNLADDKGQTPLHNAAFRGDNDMIRYLVAQGADLTAVDRSGRNVSDWANGPIQRLQPFTETLALLAELGAPPHNDRCVSC